MALQVFTAVTGAAWESELVGALDRDDHGVTVVRRSVDVADLLAMFIETLGHEVRVEHRGDTALATLEQWRADVILSDIGLPGMDGFELARRIRALPGPHRPLLVALSGYGRESDKSRAREAGFDQHLVKPIGAATVVEVLGGAPKPRRAR